MKRHRLSVRAKTRVSQVSAAIMEETRQVYCTRVMEIYHRSIANPMLFVNMNETNMHFNCKPTRTVHPTGERTISVTIGGATTARLIACVAVALDGTKLPLFLVFKGKPDGKIERNLQSILPDNVEGCVQKHARVDDRVMEMWHKKVWTPFTG